MKLAHRFFLIGALVYARRQHGLGGDRRGRRNDGDTTLWATPGINEDHGWMANDGKMRFLQTSVAAITVFGLLTFGANARAESPFKSSDFPFNYTWKQGAYSKSVVGFVRNDTQRRLRFLEITFNVYDGNGNLIGNAFDIVRNVEPGTTWQYEARLPSAAVSVRPAEPAVTAAPAD